MKHYLGIDPGKTGAFAIIAKDLSFAGAWPNTLQTSEIRSILLEFKPELAMLELVRSMNTWHKKAVASLNRSAGKWEGIVELLEIPCMEVTPSKWQKATLGKTNGGDKKLTLAWARQMFPMVELPLVKDADKADALCIALYAATWLGNETG